MHDAENVTDITASDADTGSDGRHSELQRILGVAFGIAVTIGGTIGLGILRAPGEVVGYIGRPWIVLVVWLAGGVYALLATASVMELATMMPRAGGWYVFAAGAFGEYIGFAAAVCDWLINCASLALVAIGIGEFTMLIAPGWPLGVTGTATASVAAFVALNWPGLRAGDVAQKVTSTLKAIAFGVFMAVAFAHAKATGPVAEAVGVSSGLASRLVAAIQLVIFTYDGWYSAIYFSEEDRNPSVNLPRGAIAAVLATIVIYAGMNAAMLHVLPLSVLAGSKQPATAVADVLFGARAALAVNLLSLVSLVSIFNAVLMCATRIAFGAAREGWLVRSATIVNRGGTPTVALALSGALTLALIFSGTFDELVALASFWMVALYATGFGAVIALRRNRPNAARPFAAWGYPWVQLGLLTASLGFLVSVASSDVRRAGYAALVLVATYPAYRVIKLMPRRVAPSGAR